MATDNQSLEQRSQDVAQPLSVEDMIKKNTQLVYHTLHKYFRWHLFTPEQQEDLLSAGMYGLWQAAKRFDPSLGFRFSTFAVRTICGYVSHEQRKQNHLAILPQRMQDAAIRVQALMDKTGLTGVELKDQELITLADYTAHTHFETFRVMQSLDAEFTDFESVKGSLHETLTAPPSDDSDLKMDLQMYLNQLPARQRCIIEMKTTEGWTIPEIATHLNLTSRTVTREYKTGLKTLRRWMEYPETFNPIPAPTPASVPPKETVVELPISALYTTEVAWTQRVQEIQTRLTMANKDYTERSFRMDATQRALLSAIADHFSIPTSRVIQTVMRQGLHTGLIAAQAILRQAGVSDDVLVQEFVKSMQNFRPTMPELPSQLTWFTAHPGWKRTTPLSKSAYPVPTATEWRAVIEATEQHLRMARPKVSSEHPFTERSFKLNFTQAAILGDMADQLNTTANKLIRLTMQEGLNSGFAVLLLMAEQMGMTEDFLVQELHRKLMRIAKAQSSPDVRATLYAQIRWMQSHPFWVMSKISA